jgi:hypothetical protein
VRRQVVGVVLVLVVLLLIDVGDLRRLGGQPPGLFRVALAGLGGLAGRRPAVLAGYPDHARILGPRAERGRRAQLRPVGPVKEGDEPRDIR